MSRMQENYLSCLYRQKSVNVGENGGICNHDSSLMVAWVVIKGWKIKEGAGSK